MTLSPSEVLDLFPQHDGSLIGLFESRMQRDPQRNFLQSGDRQLSWEDFGAISKRLAGTLHAKGISSGDRVAIIAPNSHAHVILLFALARLGTIMVPLNPNYAEPELAYILDHAGVSGIVGTATTIQAARHALGSNSLNPWYMYLDEPVEEASAFFHTSATEVPPVAGSAEHTCIIIYTSGTTGTPKGVMHTQRSFTLCAEMSAARVGLQPGDTALIVLPFFHVNALFYSLGSVLAAGAGAAVLPRFSASTFWQSVVETGATQVNIIETVGNILQNRPRSEFRPEHQLRVVYGVRQAFEHTFRAEFHVPQLVTGFGMSECPGVICNPLGQSKPGSMGVVAQHPLAGVKKTEARVVSADGEDVGTDEVGELWIKAPTLMQGYFREPDQTAASFCDGWFMTGDLVRRDADGYFFFVSRKKDIIRRRGENISGAELDRVISEHPSVYEAAAIAVPSELGEDEILAAIVLRPGETVNVDDIAAWCGDRLAAMKVPRYIVFVDDLPHTPTHKVAKAALREDPDLISRAVDLQRRV